MMPGSVLEMRRSQEWKRQAQWMGLELKALGGGDRNKTAVVVMRALEDANLNNEAERIYEILKENRVNVGAISVNESAISTLNEKVQWNESIAAAAGAVALQSLWPSIASWLQAKSGIKAARTKSVKAGEPIPREDLGQMLDFAVSRFLSGLTGYQKGYSGICESGLKAFDRVVENIPPDFSNETLTALASLRSDMIQLMRHIDHHMPYLEFLRSVNHKNDILSSRLTRIGRLPPLKSVKAGLGVAEYEAVATRLRGIESTLNAFAGNIRGGSGKELVRDCLRDIQWARGVLQNVEGYRPNAVSAISAELDKCARALRVLYAHGDRPSLSRAVEWPLAAARNSAQRARRLIETHLVLGKGDAAI